MASKVVERVDNHSNWEDTCLVTTILFYAALVEGDGAGRASMDNVVAVQRIVVRFSESCVHRWKVGQGHFCLRGEIMCDRDVKSGVIDASDSFVMSSKETFMSITDRHAKKVGSKDLSEKG